MISATELLIVKTLHGFVIDPGNGVAEREELVSFLIIHNAEDGGIADASAAQEQRTALHFRINFVPAESGQE